MVFAYSELLSKMPEPYFISLESGLVHYQKKIKGTDLPD
jgi:hypothetical protein